MPSRDLADDIRECLEMLDENIEALTDIEEDLDEESENELVVDVGLHELYDMGEDAARRVRLRKAERMFLRRRGGRD